MIGRFDGVANRDALIEAIRRQQFVRGDREVAEKLADVCSLAQFEDVAPKNTLIKQGDAENDILFILAGRVSVSVNNREVAIRGAGQHVGEMAMIDSSAARCATVSAIERTVVARVGERDFTAIAEAYPFLWRELAMELGNRLRERRKFVRAPNPRPFIFIGPSAEKRQVA